MLGITNVRGRKVLALDEIDQFALLAFVPCLSFGWTSLCYIVLHGVKYTLILYSLNVFLSFSANLGTLGLVIMVLSLLPFFPVNIFHLGQYRAITGQTEYLNWPGTGCLIWAGTFLLISSVVGRYWKTRCGPKPGQCWATYGPVLAFHN